MQCHCQQYEINKKKYNNDWKHQCERNICRRKGGLENVDCISQQPKGGVSESIQNPLIMAFPIT